MLNTIWNKFRQFLLRSQLRVMLGQTNPDFSLAEIFESRKTVLIPLNKSVIGSESTKLIGSLITSMLRMLILRQSSVEPSKRQQLQLQKYEHRSKEIDSIIQKLYEDNLLGKISDERFVKLSQSYEEEQKQLQTSISDLTEKLTKQQEDSLNISKFMARISKYTKLPELTVEIVNELINKIVIQKTTGTKRNRIIQIDIYYNYIGKLNNEKASQSTRLANINPFN